MPNLGVDTYGHTLTIGKQKQLTTMKTLKYILPAILLGINLVSCDPPSISEEIGIEEVDVHATKGNTGGLGEGEGEGEGDG